jgi:predicted transcriptional regulator
MATEIEISSLDLRYEGYRMKNPVLEGRLLASIAQRGIQEPLEGVRASEGFILLNGFKRHRCARQLQIRTVPIACLAEEEVGAILNLLRVSNDKTLAILEQARFLAELKQVRGMSLAEIAESLSRSKAWVSMRLSLLAEMSEAVREKLFSGAFPVYAYMYVVRPFMRMNGVNPQQIDQFVEALSGHKLSLREIEQLAHGFFRGPDSFRQEILSGNIALPLQRMKEVPPNSEGCSEYERLFLHDLELAQKYMQRIMGKSQDPRLQSKSFHAQCHLLSAGILSRAAAFHQTLRKLHDRSGQT